MTPQRAKELLPIITAFAEGKTIEWLNDGGRWTAGRQLDFNNQGHSYRIKPEPKLRPWKPEEVPLDAWYQKRGEACWGRVSSTFISGGIRYIRLFSRWNHCSDLLTDFEHSIDGGKTFHPCGVEE